MQNPAGRERGVISDLFLGGASGKSGVGQFLQPAGAQSVGLRTSVNRPNPLARLKWRSGSLTNCLDGTLCD